MNIFFKFFVLTGKEQLRETNTPGLSYSTSYHVYVAYNHYGTEMRFLTNL